MELTEAEITMALTICTTKGASCKDCPAFVKVDRSNCKKVFLGAIDLINRKNAENEEMTYSLERLQSKYDTLLMSRCGDEKLQFEYVEAVKETARAEAIKEVFEKVEGTTWYRINHKGELVVGANSETDVPLYKAEDIYQIAKEMGVEL